MSDTRTEFVIAATPASALIVAHLIRDGQLPRLYGDTVEAVEAFYQQPTPMQAKYRLFACTEDGAATVFAAGYKAKHASHHASTSPGPVNCNTRLHFQHQPYPRTCERCGLGPCPFFNPDGTAIRNTYDYVTAVNEYQKRTNQ